MRHRVSVSFWDAIKSLIRTGRVEVVVTVDGTPEAVEDVMELDADYLGHQNTRRHEFNAGINRALSELSPPSP